MLIVDKYAYTNKLSDSNPMAKFYFAIVMIFVSLLIKNSYIFIGIILMMFFVTVFLAGIPAKNYIRILIIPLSFLLFSVLTLLVCISKSEIDYLWGTRILGFSFVITKHSIDASIILFLRAIASVSCTFFLVLTTPINQLVYVFKRIRIPKLFIEMFVLIYRFIFIFLEEAREIYVAQEMRFGYRNIGISYHSLSSLIAVLFIRVMCRYKDMETALETRGFNKEFYV